MNYVFVRFQTKAQQPSVSEPANAPSIGMTFAASFKDEHWHLPF
jgi:hypothetical protein